MGRTIDDALDKSTDYYISLTRGERIEKAYDFTDARKDIADLLLGLPSLQDEKIEPDYYEFTPEEHTRNELREAIRQDIAEALGVAS